MMRRGGEKRVSGDICSGALISSSGFQQLARRVPVGGRLVVVVVQFLAYCRGRVRRRFSCVRCRGACVVYDFHGFFFVNPSPTGIFWGGGSWGCRLQKLKKGDFDST